MGKKILVTGAAGFIAGYVIEKLLKKEWDVIGIDNYSKYGKISKSYDTHPNYTFIEGDAKDVNLLKHHLEDCDHFIHLASKIGGITYFVTYPYSLLAENERLMASAMDAAIWAKQNKKLKKITLISSSMIFESTKKWPSKEEDYNKILPPESSYGFQKFATHYWAESAKKEFNLDYTIIIPWNCIGLGEHKALGSKQIKSGNCVMAMSHVVPDLIQKIIKGQDPLHILGNGNQIRHYTYGADLADGIYITLNNPKAKNQAFNLSTPDGHTVKELAEIIWKKINGDSISLKLKFDPPFPYDVQKRVPDIKKAKEILGFESKTKLENALDYIIPWIKQQVELGTI